MSDTKGRGNWLLSSSEICLKCVFYTVWFNHAMHWSIKTLVSIHLTMPRITHITYYIAHTPHQYSTYCTANNEKLHGENGNEATQRYCSSSYTYSTQYTIVTTEFCGILLVGSYFNETILLFWSSPQVWPRLVLFFYHNFVLLPTENHSWDCSKMEVVSCQASLKLVHCL